MRKENSSKDWLPSEFGPFTSVASSSILAAHGRIVPQNKYLWVSFKIIRSAGIIPPSLLFSSHAEMCYGAPLLIHIWVLKPLALVHVCNQTALTLRRITLWPQKITFKLHLNLNWIRPWDFISSSVLYQNINHWSSMTIAVWIRIW